MKRTVRYALTLVVLMSFTASTVLATVFSNTTSITTNLNPAAGTAAPYPSVINVSGLTGTVTTVKVTLTGVNHTFPDDVDVLLVGPTGANLILTSDAGGGNDWVDANLTFDDAAAAQLGDGTANPTGSYKPTNHGGTVVDTFPAPAPAPPNGNPGPSNTGTATLTTTFAGTDPNGAWSLYIMDDAGGDDGVITGGWSIAVTTSGSAETTFTNTGRIRLNDLRAASTPYPSGIAVSGLTGTVTDINVTLHNITHPNPDDLDIMLVGPNGAGLLIMSDAGGTTDVAGVTVTIDDGAAAPIPDSGPLATGSFKPTNFTLDTFPAPAPETWADPGGTGAGATLASVFNGTDPNGTWNLYVVDDVSSTTSQGSIAGGWSIDIAAGGAAGGQTNRLDFYANGYSDWAVLTPGVPNIIWKILKNENPTPPGPGEAELSIIPFGLTATDEIPAFGDYTGNGSTDLNVWRPGAQSAYWLQPFKTGGDWTRVPWGIETDIWGAEGDYDGDGRLDFTVIRSEAGTARWWILNSATSTVNTFTFGTVSAANGFLPGADYNGDGIDDPATIRLGVGSVITWHIGNTSGQQIAQVQWGDFDTDFVIPAGDYDGDNKADFMVWRGFGNAPGAPGDWWLLTSSGTTSVTRWGLSSSTTANRDIPLRSGDYDNDGKTDIAVWRRSNQRFYVLRSSDGALMEQQWGAAGDIPLASFGTF